MCARVAAGPRPHKLLEKISFGEIVQNTGSGLNLPPLLLIPGVKIRKGLGANKIGLFKNFRESLKTFQKFPQKNRQKICTFFFFLEGAGKTMFNSLRLRLPKIKSFSNGPNGTCLNLSLIHI